MANKLKYKKRKIENQKAGSEFKIMEQIVSNIEETDGKRFKINQERFDLERRHSEKDEQNLECSKDIRERMKIVLNSAHVESEKSEER